MSDRIKPLLAMLERGQDSALLRFSLGNEYFASGDAGEAALHLSKAVELDCTLTVPSLLSSLVRRPPGRRP